MNTPAFHSIDSSQVALLAGFYAKRGHRRIRSIHVHANHIPGIRQFEELSEKLGSAELASLSVCRALWRQHVQSRGWSHTGQHLLIDPTGVLWLCRPWDLPPVSVSGLNGNITAGPLCVSVIGDFTDLMEVMPTAQQHSLETTLAALLDGFNLDMRDCENPYDLGACGHQSGIDMANLGARVQAQREKSAPVKKRKPANQRSPLDERQVAEHALSQYLLVDADAATPATRRIESTSGLDVDLSEQAMANLTAQSSAGSRGFYQDLTPTVLRQLKQHVINLRQGEFSSDGEFCTTQAEVDNLMDQTLEKWVLKQIENGKTPRLMIHAHGGLNSEEKGVAYAGMMRKWWLDQEIYPIFFVWETGVIESIMQLIESSLHRGQRGVISDLVGKIGDVRDVAVEEMIRVIGQDFWSVMKLSASRASESQPGRGAHYLAQKLDALIKRHKQTIEVHAVGHSAGAIFHAWFLRECYEGQRKVPFKSVTLLAPACTVSLFNNLLSKRIDGKRIHKLRLFNLDSRTERRDPTVPMYGKSLLHLVSNGFEGNRDTPILGMEDAIRKDFQLSRHLGLATEHNKRIDVVFAPTDPDAVDTQRSTSTTHGGFSVDADTLTSIALTIRSETAATAIPPLPTGVRGARGANAHTMIFDPLSARLDEGVQTALFGKRGVVDTAAQPTMGSDTDSNMPDQSLVSANGAHRALCIGIDTYADPYRLQGCVNDAVAWSNAFRDLGFQTNLLLNEQATARGILDSISALIREARSGDLLAIQYAGHGIQLPDSDGDERDGDDEALVPIDNQQQLFVSDDELWDVLQSGVDGVQIVVFMDCCHSRSNSRALPAVHRRARMMIPDKRMATAHRERLAKRTRSHAITLRSIEDMKHIKFSACADKELAFEDQGQGNFTRAAIRTLQDMTPGMSNEQVRLAIEHNFVADGKQHPGLECPTAMKTQSFLGGIAHATSGHHG